MDKSTIDAYDKISSEFHERNSAPLYEEQYGLFKSFTDGNKLLEIGCGTGRDAEELLKVGFEYTGIDASEGMLRTANERVKGGSFLKSDFESLIFPDQSFDCFWAAATFLHVSKKDIDKVLQETKRVLKKGGTGFISLKQKTAIGEGYIIESKAGGIERYFAFYTPEEAPSVLSRNGFEILSNVTKTEKDGTNWLCYIVKNLGELPKPQLPA